MDKVWLFGGIVILIMFIFLGSSMIIGMNDVSRGALVENAVKETTPVPEDTRTPEERTADSLEKNKKIDSACEVTCAEYGGIRQNPVAVHIVGTEGDMVPVTCCCSEGNIKAGGLFENPFL
ncbi:MAG: hypothetical protein ABH849_00660 [Nanoarchaeota archaeon]